MRQLARPKIAVYVLGCKVNQTEAEAILKLFEDAGYQRVDFSEKADVYVIHTCTVTGESDRKSRRAVRRALRTNPHAKVAVTGCYVQTSPGEVLGIPGVHLMVGTGDLNRIVDLVRDSGGSLPVQEIKELHDIKSFEDLPPASSDRTRAFLKVQDGCQQFCSYCIIPYARGPLRSRRPEDSLESIRHFVQRGYHEIVLTGIRLGAYGVDLRPRSSLAELLREACRTPGLKRMRISSVDPHDFTPELVEIITSKENICPHFHIPLQSGDDTVLESMGRKYSVKDYAHLIDSIRAGRPGAALTTDVMVGFPGETRDQFAATKNCVKSIQFMDVHVFKYSPRKGTPAAGFSGQVSGPEKTRRSSELQEMAASLYAAYAEGYLGKTLEILVEQRDEQGFWEGHAPNYLRTKFPGQGDLEGEIVSVEVTSIGNKFVWGRGHV